MRRFLEYRPLRGGLLGQEIPVRIYGTGSTVEQAWADLLHSLGYMLPAGEYPETRTYALEDLELEMSVSPTESFYKFGWRIRERERREWRP
ncbi:MAG: hypothetical protein QW356_04680 [Candidatus Hadarchaeales archaeon]